MNKTLLLGYVACMGLGTLQAQEADSLLTVNKMKELEEIVVKGGFPNTRLKGNSMVTRVEGTALASTGTADEMLIKVPQLPTEPQLSTRGSGCVRRGVVLPPGLSSVQHPEGGGPHPTLFPSGWPLHHDLAQ